MQSNSPPLRQSASHVDPTSIEARSHCAPGAEVLVRSRAPGRVRLPGGQREHMLMCSFGRPVDGEEVRSVLRTEAGVHRWRDCPRGQVTFVPAGLPIEWEWTYTSQSVHVAIQPDFLDELGHHMAAPGGRSAALRPVYRVLNDSLSRLLLELRSETVAGDAGNELAKSSLLTLVGVHLLRMIAPGPGVSEISENAPAGLSAAIRQRCIKIIHDRLDENLSLAELAREFGLSPYHFTRLFKRATGFPPHEYQLQMRVCRARVLLLARPRRTVAEIACELGFADESHLRRHFKRIVGMTPGRFRA